MTRRNGRLSERSRNELETIDLTPDRRKPTDLFVVNDTTKTQAILDIAAQLARNGKPTTGREIAAVLGHPDRLNANRIDQIITGLRKSGRWPHGYTRPTLRSRIKAESAAANGHFITAADIMPTETLSGPSDIVALTTCIQTLDALDLSARGRVWRFLADRYESEK